MYCEVALRIVEFKLASLGVPTRCDETSHSHFIVNKLMCFSRAGLEFLVYSWSDGENTLVADKY